MLDIFTALSGGATVVPLATAGQKLRPSDVIRLKQITVWHSVPSAFDLMDRGRQLRPEVMRSLRLVIFCGERLFPTLVKKIWAAGPEITIYNTYGPTETTILVAYLRLSKANLDDVSRSTVSIGSPLPGNTLEIRNADEGDGLGELIISGANVGLGYLGDAISSGYEFGQCGREPQSYHSGDFCRISNGMLYFECRRDSQVKILGNRVDLSEIDLALRGVGCSNSATVFHEGKIISFVLASSMSTEELKDRLRALLPAYYLPSLIILSDEFPYTSSGKVDLKVLVGALAEQEL